MRGFIAVDGGGSKTEVILVSELGEVLKHKIVDCTNPNDVGMDNTISILTNVLKEFLDTKYSVECIFLAIAGIEFGDSKNILLDNLKTKLKYENIYIDGDLASVKEAGLSDYSNGIVIIAGTGFNMAIKKNDKFNGVGGWGYLADDFFSGFDLGKEALVRASRAIDGIDKNTILVSLLEEHFGNTLWYSMGSIYNSGVKGVASLSKIVFKAYLNNDEVAKEIVDNRLNKLVHVIKEKSNDIEGNINVCLFGGIFENNDFLVEKLANMLSEKYIVNTTSKKTIYGAVSLGIKKIKNVDEEFYRSFDKSYKERCK